MKRRAFLTGLLAAPVVITTPGLLMPVKRPVWTGPMIKFSTDYGKTWRSIPFAANALSGRGDVTHIEISPSFFNYEKLDFNV